MAALVQISLIKPTAISLRERQLSFLEHIGHQYKLDYKSLQVTIIPYSNRIECDLGLRAKEMNF